MAGFLSKLAKVSAAGGNALYKAGGGSKGIGGFLSGTQGEDPYEKASPYFQQAYDVNQEQYNPYIDEGTRARNTLPDLYSQQRGLYENAPNPYENAQDLYANPGIDFNESPAAYGEMARNPQGFLRSIEEGYRPSAGYGYKERKLLDAARNSSAAGGFTGTELDRERNAGLVQGLLGEDMQQFLQNVLGIQGRGLTGEENRINRRQGGQERMLQGRERFQDQRLAGNERALERRLSGINQGLNNQIGENRERQDRGYNASSNFANAAATNAGQQGALAFHGQNRANYNRNTRNQSLLNLITRVGSAAAGQGGY